MLCNLVSKAPAKDSTKKRIRPTLEVLEDRTAPAVDVLYGGGPTIPHVQVTNIVMGAQPLNTTVLMQDLVHDYLPLLGSSYGIGAGTLRSSVNVAPLPGNPSDSQIQNFIVKEMNSGQVPAPNGSQLYFTFLQQGQSTAEYAGTDALGYHANFYVIHNSTGYHIANSAPAGTSLIPVNYAVSMGTNKVSYTASHELAEAVTDPNGNGFRDPLNPLGGEVADVYEFLPGFTMDGFQVATLSGPQGQLIGPPNATPGELIALFFEELEAMAYQYLSAIDPQFIPAAQAANEAVNANPFNGLPLDQMYSLLLDMVFPGEASMMT